MIFSEAKLPGVYVVDIERRDGIESVEVVGVDLLLDV